jgi:DNA repair exonuclease SbcCD nuclease subunit
MRGVACADLHITSNKPKYRKDKDYLRTGLDKFNQIIDFANKKNCPVICAGDLFDHYSVSHTVVNMILDCLKNLKNEFYLILGQHDVPYHNFNVLKSPIGTLLRANRVVLLNNKWTDGLYGMNFGDEKIIHPKSKDSILVIHTPITEFNPPFYMKDAISADTALNKKFIEFKAIISGDFHHAFILQNRNRMLINCGSMMRKNLDQMDVIPSCWYFDTKKGIIIQKELNVKPKEDVFNLQLANKEKIDKTVFSTDMKQLIETLKKQDSLPTINDTANIVMKKRKTSKRIQLLVNKFLGVHNE